MGGWVLWGFKGEGELVEEGGGGKHRQRGRIIQCRKGTFKKMDGNAKGWRKKNFGKG